MCFSTLKPRLSVVIAVLMPIKLKLNRRCIKILNLVLRKKKHLYIFFLFPYIFGMFYVLKKNDHAFKGEIRKIGGIHSLKIENF